MRRKRRRNVLTLLAMLLLASGLLVLRLARSERASAVVVSPSWQPNDWYRLKDRDSVVHCELPAGARYRLVIGCLSDAAQEYQVRLRLIPNLNQPQVAQSERCSRLVPCSQVAPAHRELAEPKISGTLPEISEQLVPTTREFFLHVTDGDLEDPKQYARITARSVACGVRVRVFLDHQLPDGEVPPARIEELLQMMETDVVPRVEAQFGPLQDVDRDGRFAVVLTPWLSRLQGGRTSIRGMVRSSDFRIDVAPPMGNRGDMLFLNSALPSDAALRDLLSHEVAHAACLSQRLLQQSEGLSEEEDWLSEALAHLAEPGWSNLDHRLAAFLEEPSQYPLVVPDYYRAGLWRNPGCRGATYLFTRWCVERHGPNLIRRLVESRTSGARNLEQATGRRFEELFQDWSLSLASGDELAAPDLRTVLARLDSCRLRPTVFSGDNNHEQTLRVRGTAFQVVELRLSSSESRTLQIVGETAARWQFSICRIPDESPGSGDNHPLVTNRSEAQPRHRLADRSF